MAQLIQPFNANNFDPTQGVGGLPIGRHPVIVDSSEVKANKANDGGYLQLNLKVIDGPQAGTIGAYRLNLYHSNPQTVEIANRQLSAISHVTGVFMIQDSAQLHNIPFVIEVGPQKNDAQYTEVKKVFDINGNEPGKAPQGGGAAQPQNNGGFGGQQQQPNNAQGGAWGGQSNAGQQGGQQGGGWQQPGGDQQQPPAGGQGGGWQPPADNGQQQQPPANGGGAWGGQAGAAQPNNAQGGGFQPPAGQQQQPQGGGQAGGWQQGANAGGAAPWGQR